ncbi:hypothetical protein [Arsenicicoccus dermatophilus]|uniref:hypothetical protein n=1 Tax=Arsenicicoccus dermatophilus TaxID=1076331 RepID=UPI00391714EE
MPSPRISWPDVADQVRSWAERTLGSPVVRWHPQTGGWSPGTADRLVCADGTRAFLKAAHPGLNPLTPDFYRREIAVARLLGPAVPCAHLLDAHDDGEWVALLLEDVEGRHAQLPWRPDELAAILDALTRLATATTPVSIPGSFAPPSGTSRPSRASRGCGRSRRPTSIPG